MKTNPEHSHRETSVDADAAEPFGGSAVTRHLVIGLCFVAGGWAMLQSGQIFWGVACLVAALFVTALLGFVERYQHRYPAMAQAKQERETEQLIAIARREMDATGTADGRK